MRHGNHSEGAVGRSLLKLPFKARVRIAHSLLGILKQLSVSWAIVIGAAIIGLSIIASQFVAPYRLSPFAAQMWRLNTITGEAQICIFSTAEGAKTMTGAEWTDPDLSHRPPHLRLHAERKRGGGNERDHDDDPTVSHGAAHLGDGWSELQRILSRAYVTTEIQMPTLTQAW